MDINKLQNMYEHINTIDILYNVPPLSISDRKIFMPLEEWIKYKLYFDLLNDMKNWITFNQKYPKLLNISLN